MQTIIRPRQTIDLAAFKQRSAAETDYDLLLREPFTLQSDNATRAVYLDLAGDPNATAALDELFDVLQRVKYNHSARTDGLITTSRTFGFKPRNTLRSDFCSAASMASEQPQEHAAVAALAPLIGRYYQQHAPLLYAEHAALAREKVLPQYHLEDDVFTSGIINENNPLKFHFDTGNFKGVWSAMLAFKRDIGGGYLALPEYGIAAEIKDRSLFLFDGQDILHGVTPIRRLADDAVRYTVVYYSLRQMWNCAPIDEELLRIRRLRTQREAQRQRKVAP